MHLPSHIANLNVLAGTPAPSPFRTLYPSAHPTTLSSTADDDAGLGNNGVDDPALEESLKRHLDLWINTEFSWTEDQAGAGAGGSPRDKVEGVFDAVDPQQLVGKDAEGEIEMDLMEYYKSRVKQGKEKNVLLDQRLGADEDKDKDEIRVGGEDRGTSVKEVQLVERGRRVETDHHVPVATPAVASTPTTGGNVVTQPPASGPAPDLASFLTQYSALLSSSIPSLDSLTPASGRPRAAQAQRGQKQVEVEQVNRGGKDLEARSVDEQKKSSTSHSHSEPFIPSSSNAVPSSDTRQQQQSHQPTPRARHLHPPAPPINSPVLESAVLASDPSRNTKSNSKSDDARKDTDKLPGQEQNLMALLAAAFPQYASTFEAPAQQQQQQQNAAMNAFLLNHHASANGNGAGSARSPPQHESTPAATPFVYAPHDAGFGHGHAGMNFGSSHHHQQQQQHQQLSGEIDRVFGSVDLGEGLYHHGHGRDESNANKTVDIVPSAQGGMELRRAGSASAGSLSDAASLHNFDTQAQRQHQLQNQNLVQQQLAVMSSSVTSSPQGKRRKLSDDSGVGPNSNSVYQPRYTQASLASLTAQAMGPGHPSSYGPAHAHVHAHGQGYGSRKRSMDSMEADLHDSGVLPDGVTPEEDKRRRNTAASARFRMKKKEREQALERHAKDLEDRLNKMERDMDGLRKENGWLKALLINGAPQPFSSPSASSEEGKIEAAQGHAQSVE